jgi:hypothetical protein
LAEGAQLGVDDTSDIEGSILIDENADGHVQAAIANAESTDPEIVRLEALLNQPSPAKASQQKSEEKVLAGK